MLPCGVTSSSLNWTDLIFDGLSWVDMILTMNKLRLFKKESPFFSCNWKDKEGSFLLDAEILCLLPSLIRDINSLWMGTLWDVGLLPVSNLHPLSFPNIVECFKCIKYWVQDKMLNKTGKAGSAA